MLIGVISYAKVLQQRAQRWCLVMQSLRQIILVVQAIQRS
jgi:hypothetical protein